MNTLSKAQVIALFLGSASAVLPDLTPIQLLNGPTSEGQPSGVGAEGHFFIPSSGTTCAGNAACTAVNDKGTSVESCGAFQIAGATETSSFCVQTDMCGALGNINGTNFSLQCWTTPADGATAVAPAAVDPAALLTALNGLITKDTVTWTEKNVLVSPKFNWMDGWYIQQESVAGPHWVETDKPADNRCFFNSQCGADECCGNYPDSSNRRCMAKSIDKVLQTVGPVSFTPTCAVEDGGVDVVPENAQDDIASGALADASEALNSFWTNQVNDKKTAASYEKMDAEAKAAFDAEIAAEEATNDSILVQLKTAIGYSADACDDNCKAIFEADVLKWRKNVYEICKENRKAITCQKANELRIQEDTARAAATDGNFYSGQTADQRAAFEKGRTEEIAKNEASLVAAFVADPDNIAKSGDSGFACVESACEVGTEKFWCCGTSNRVGNEAGNTIGQKTKVCARVDASGGDTRYTGAWEDGLGVKYQHTCDLAQKLVATAAAALAAAYTLM